MTLQAPAHPIVRIIPAEAPADPASFKAGQAAMLAEVEGWAVRLGCESSERLRELVKQRRAELAGRAVTDG